MLMFQFGRLSLSSTYHPVLHAMGLFGFMAALGLPPWSHPKRWDRLGLDPWLPRPTPRSSSPLRCGCELVAWRIGADETARAHGHRNSRPPKNRPLQNVPFGEGAMEHAQESCKDQEWCNDDAIMGKNGAEKSPNEITACFAKCQERCQRCERRSGRL